MKYFTVFQPIFDMAGGRKRIGLEALLRAKNRFRTFSGYELFEKAGKLGEIAELDKMARRLALEEGMSLLTQTDKLFLNVNSHTWAGEIETIPCPERIVLEISENTDATYYESIQQQLEVYRNQGMQIAIDDFGVRRTNFRMLSALKPDWIKLDMSFVRNSDFSMIKNVRRFAEDIGVKLIVEGIETEYELEAVLDCGVRYIQGFALGMPETAEFFTHPLDV